MVAAQPHRRALLIAPEGQLSELEASVATNWEVTRASTVALGCFLLTSQPCNMVILAGQAGGPDWEDNLNWLGSRVPAPLLLLTEDFVPDVVLPVLQRGAIWLPLSAATTHPSLLQGALEKAWQQQLRNQEAQRNLQLLNEAQTQVDRLINMLWQVSPGRLPGPWFTQRYMMTRLGEEVARTQRHGGPLSVVLGEMRSQSGERLDNEMTGRLTDWLANQIGLNKRRNDVAGQYGTSGFMLLLPQGTTTEAVGACRRLSRVLAHPPHGLPGMRTCFGLASVPNDRANVPALLSRAEERLDRASRSPQGGIIASEENDEELSTTQP